MKLEVFYFNACFLTKYIQTFNRNIKQSHIAVSKSNFDIINNFESFDNYQKFSRSLSEIPLMNNIWLFLYSYSNITEETFRKLTMNEEFDAQTNLKFNSRVFHLSFTDVNTFN